MIDINTPSVEKAAISALQSVGIDDIRLRFDEINDAGQHRLDELNGNCAIPASGFTGLNYLSEDELEDRLVLLTAIQMHDRATRCSGSSRALAGREDRLRRYRRQSSG